MTSINSLGHVIRDKGITMDPSKTKAILSGQTPLAHLLSARRSLKDYWDLPTFIEEWCITLLSPALP